MWNTGRVEDNKNTHGFSLKTEGFHKQYGT